MCIGTGCREIRISVSALGGFITHRIFKKKNKKLFPKESLINLFFFFPLEVFLSNQGKECPFNET